MDSSIRAQRYEQLWDAGTTSVRRVALGGVIFAVLVLLKVVGPHWDKENSWKVELSEQIEVMAEVQEELEEVEAAEIELIGLEEVIEKQPWKA